MAELVKEILWLGIEDFTGLWDAAYTVQFVEKLPSLEIARDRARSVLEVLLADGLVELYQFQGPPQNDATPVESERRSGLLRVDGFWVTSGKEDEPSVWFDTTEKGFELYCKQHNGGVWLPRE